MSSGNVDLAVRFFELLTKGEIDAGLALASDDFLLDRSRSNAPWRGVTRGRAAARHEYATFIEGAWDVSENPTWEVTDTRSLGSDLVGLATRMRVRGRASGIEIDARGGWLARIDDGRMTEAVLYQSFADALLDGRRRLLDRARLYFVCEARPNGSEPRPVLDAALRGGVEIVQLRDKQIADEYLVAVASAFREAADRHGALFFLNDRPDLVAACDADGVHVGQDDVPVAEARRIAGPAVAVGLSTHTPGQLDAAIAATGVERPDQISAGPVWETPTKSGRPAAGLELIRHAAKVAPNGPWFAIGGIDAANVGEVAAAGARRVVVVRAIRDAADSEAAARELRDALGPG